MLRRGGDGKREGGSSEERAEAVVLLPKIENLTAKHGIAVLRERLKTVSLSANFLVFSHFNFMHRN